jgi:hypothetical protein
MLNAKLERCRSFRGDGVGGFSMGNLILPGGPAFIAAEDGRKCRLADLTGRPIVKTIFESAGAFNNGFAEVSVNASEFFGPLKKPTRKQFVGLIDRSGAFVVPPIYDRVLMRTVGLVQVSFGGRQGYVDMAGKPITFSQDELDRYVTEWREIFNTGGFIPGRTITAKAADGDYHFYLPAGQCVLDKKVSTDSRIFDEFRARMEAAREFVRKRASEQGEKTTKLNMVQYFQDASGMFAPCSELEAFRTTGDRSRLKTIGSATGSRRGVRDPSANAGIVFVAMLVCKAKQGMQALKENAETIDSRNARIDDAIDSARAGNAVNLPSISMKTLGCVSAILQPASKRDGHSKLDRRISATFASVGVVPDWTLSIETSVGALETRSELVHQLERESDMLDGIIRFNLRMASQ